MDGATKPVLDAWFDAYRTVIQEYKIMQENTYNMDESGFSIGTMESTRIILDSTFRTKHQAHPGHGTILPPLGIFKGENVLQNWIPKPLDVAIFGPLKKRLTAALSHLNQAQLVRIQKIEWMETYIQARSEACTQQNIESAWRGAGLFPFNPQRALRTMVLDTTPELERPRTPTEFDIFDPVFVNSPPPDATSLRPANELLNSTINSDAIPTTPQLQARSIVHQHDANNLRSIIKKRTNRTKGKTMVLNSQFHVSTQELCDAVAGAEKDTKTQKGKGISYETESEWDIEEGTQDEFESDTEDCLIVDVE
ncbi:hypothetical protein LIPSTDRAFT_76430 [Lipomyces starkeyi NRRL Y-11557]|uniref:DDE-1 domain-containing protein n=1 Tax=Lipomyces starkeyi NRRL Y-11557 TaxID=675824 RepID=A0A1E3PV24_LIPST|nr:hypothetical protein LIPSTDRAFT_76430 [Lipomyces starkeyi NRRL Y-11557]